MAIELDIPKDIHDFETPFLLGLTMRQCICAASGLAAALISYTVIGKFTDTGIKVIIPLIFVGVAFLFGWVKMYNMPFEKYLVSQMMTTILPPKKRPYKIENKYEVLQKEIEKEDAEAAKAKQKQNPQINKENKKKSLMKGGNK